MIVAAGIAACGSVGADHKDAADTGAGGASAGDGGGQGGIGPVDGATSDAARDTPAGDAPATDASGADTRPDVLAGSDTGPAVNDGSSAARAADSCRLLLAAVPGTPSGLYWLRPDAGAPARRFYCDMTTDGGGWMQVFKLNDGTTGDPAALWSGGALNEDRAELAGTAKASDNFVSSILGRWNVAPFGIADVRVVFYLAGQERAFAKFSGALTTRTSWFDKGHIVASSWTDLTAAATANFFSIEGDPTYGRRFFANVVYGGCAVDTGWMAVVAGDLAVCDWEDLTSPSILIVYSNRNLSSTWASAFASRADAYAVYVR